MNFGQRGRDLVLECQKGGKGSLLKYNAALVRGCLEEVTWHIDELNHIVESLEANEGEDSKPPLQVRPSMFLHDASIRRNKQCLLAYMNHRVNIMRKSGGSLSSSSTTGSSGDDAGIIKRSLLSEAEQDFLQSYSKLRDEYSQTMELDLRPRPTVRLPPTQSSSLMQVRVLAKDMGTLVLGNGNEVQLVRGSIHYLPINEIQEFVENGDLQQLDGEEML